jgi:glycosyltransferase involved in cell wall biosynthesis
MISFIVPAHNEEQHLGSTLRAIRSAAVATGGAYEVIVVDDASDDRTAEIALAACARVERVQHRQISRTRNAGAHLASGDRFIFVDADTIVSPALLRAALAAMDAGAIAGGATLRMDGRVPLYIHGLLAVTAAVMRRNNWIAGCYVFCTREAFHAVGGFDESLFATEEIAFSKAVQRIGRVVLLDEEVVTSGRKARSHSAWHLVRLLAVFVLRGPAMLRTRTHLGLWYGERRKDRVKEKGKGKR